jgi:hypothetical protein
MQPARPQRRGRPGRTSLYTWLDNRDQGAGRDAYGNYADAVCAELVHENVRRAPLARKPRMRNLGGHGSMVQRAYAADIGSEGVDCER